MELLYHWQFSFFFLFVSLFDHLSYCQQPYLNNLQLNCDRFDSVTGGYVCSDQPQSSCNSFVTFRSSQPYDTAVTIAYLLGSSPSEVALINNISNSDKVAPDKPIIVPVSCSCSSGFYQHDTPYTVNETDTYFTIANNTYGGLTTCQALVARNLFVAQATNLSAGSELMVPVRCACPSANQTSNGVSFLISYMITWGDTISSIGNLFGVDEHSINEANELAQDDLIFPFTPLLIPLESKSCTDKPGYFFCSCPNGHFSDGICIPHGKGFPVKLVTLLGVGIGSGVLFLVLCCYWLYWYLKKKKHLRQREKLFKQNGGLLLQQQLSSHKGTERGKIYTAEELQRATDNYNQSRFLGQGGFGTVYKGMLPDGGIVAVKRSKAVDKNRIEQFINEVVILSQINHRNVVKLLGCCLETEFPLLVYEFIANGTLSHHIHEQQEPSLSWAIRLRIASEVAGAVAYMHSAASIPIFHRDIKSSNILLDEKYSAKVSDFGTSRSIPLDQTHLTTTVQGTFGYLDPEYFRSSQFTEKSDVYSFGVVLVELITGQKPISFARAEEEINLVAHFMSLIEENRLFEVIDPQVAREAETEHILAIAELATRCLRLNGKMRPTMKDVAMEIEGLRKNQRCLEIHQELKNHSNALLVKLEKDVI